MDIITRLREAITAPGGHQKYAQVVEAANLEAIAYQNGLMAEGMKKRQALDLGQNYRDLAILRLMGA